MWTPRPGWAARSAPGTGEGMESISKKQCGCLHPNLPNKVGLSKNTCVFLSHGTEV